MDVKLLLLLTTAAFLYTKQCSTTVLADFNKGTKFHLIKDKVQKDNSFRAYEKPRNDPNAKKCEEEKQCSSGDQFQIQPKTLLGCISNCLKPKMAERNDLEFIYYSSGIVSYCSSKNWILSGVFSGCLMTVWDKSSAGRRVGHVDTDPDKAGDKCKTYMKANTGTFFKPYNDDIDKAIALWKTHKVAVDAFGLVSDADDFYTVFAKKLQPPNVDVWEIVENPIKRDQLNLKDITR